MSLSTVDGNILDAWAEQVDALTDAEATAKAQHWVLIRAQRLSPNQ